MVEQVRSTLLELGRLAESIRLDKEFCEDIQSRHRCIERAILSLDLPTATEDDDYLWLCLDVSGFVRVHKTDAKTHLRKQKNVLWERVDKLEREMVKKENKLEELQKEAQEELVREMETERRREKESGKK